MTSPPTTMAVRDATVGPQSGTMLVSCGATSTASAPMPSSAATSWGKIVLVPWPISVCAVRTRIEPVSVSCTDATPAICTSPDPVKPAPCQPIAIPIPDAQAGARLPGFARTPGLSLCRAKSAASAAASRTSIAATLSRSTWPVGVTSPSR